MIERPESGQTADQQDPFKAQTPEPGHFLKDEDTTDVEADGVEDASEGMSKPDYLGKSNLANRGKESEEDK